MGKKSKVEQWINKCADSNGTMIMLPAKMSEKGDKFIEESKEYIEKCRAFDKMTAEFEVYAKNFWHEVRLGLEKDNVKGAFSNNVGWNQQALDEGVKVLNVIQSGPAQMR